jgi:hypothetical protein
MVAGQACSNVDTRPFFLFFGPCLCHILFPPARHVHTCTLAHLPSPFSHVRALTYMHTHTHTHTRTHTHARARTLPGTKPRPQKLYSKLAARMAGPRTHYALSTRRWWQQRPRSRASGGLEGHRRNPLVSTPWRSTSSASPRPAPSDRVLMALSRLSCTAQKEPRMKFRFTGRKLTTISSSVVTRTSSE